MGRDRPGALLARGFVPVGHGELWYELAGRGDPQVVLLHAGLLSSRMWDAQFEMLRRHCTVVRYDARGHGRSTVPEGDFSHHVDLHQVLTHLRLHRPMLVGLSLGARTAVDFSLAFPDESCSLLLASPGLSGWTSQDSSLDGPRARLRAAVAEGDWEKAASEFAGMWVYGPFRSADEAPQALRGRFEATIAATLRGTAGSGWTPTEVGATDRLSDIGVPSTIVTGGRDCRVIREMAEAIAAASPRHRLLEMPAAGHLLNLEAAASFNEIVLRCLAEARDP